MLIKSNPPRAVEPTPVEQVSMEDIDHVISTYELQGVVTSIESLHNEIVHANDIATSTEQLALVLEGIMELSITDAALIQVVGDIAGASCGVDGSAFTPSMEDAEEGVPLGQKIKAILNQIAAFIRKVFAQIKMYIAHQFSKSHRIAKKYETLGESIRNYDFTKATEIDMRDVAGTKGGLLGVGKALPVMTEAMNRCFLGGSQVFTAQVQCIEAVEAGGLAAYPTAATKVIETLKSVAGGYSADPHHATVMGESYSGLYSVSEILIGGDKVSVYVPSLDYVIKDSMYDALFQASIEMERTEPAATDMTKFKISHQLVKDVFDALRPVVDVLTNPSSPTGFNMILKGVEAKGDELDKWLHKQVTLPPEQQARSGELVRFYRMAGAKIAHSQLRSLIHTHHHFQRVLQIVIDYMDQCLTKATPQAVKPEQTAMPATA